MTKHEAVSTVMKNLDRSFSKDTLSTIYKEKSINEIYISDVTEEDGNKGEDEFIITVVFNNKVSRERLRSAEIHEDCDLEWRR